jgi:hypothetical protein
MWDPQRLTTLWAFTVCYGDSFTLLVPNMTLFQSWTRILRIIPYFYSLLFSTIFVISVAFLFYVFLTTVHGHKFLYSSPSPPPLFSTYLYILFTISSSPLSIFSTRIQHFLPSCWVLILLLLLLSSPDLIENWTAFITVQSVPIAGQSTREAEHYDPHNITGWLKYSGQIPSFHHDFW